MPKPDDRGNQRDHRAQATVTAADAATIAGVLEGQGLAPELVAALRNGGWVKVLGPDETEPAP